jgi:hypothetical protein
MERRSARQLGLAAIPVMLLAQCAPQCAPACTPSSSWVPVYNDRRAGPDPLVWTASDDGRYLGVGDPTGRLDVDSHALVPTAITGLLSGDAAAVVGVDDNMQVARFVLFWSAATDLQGGAGDPNGRLYVRDLHEATTTLLPVVPTSDLGGSISTDGLRIAFPVDATVTSRRAG